MSLSFRDQSYLESYGNPAAFLLHVDAGEAVLPAVVFAILHSLLHSASSHHGTVSINSHLEVGDLTRVILKGAGFETGQNLCFRSQLTSLVNESVVIGSHPIQCRGVTLEQRLVAFALDLFDLFLSSMDDLCVTGRLRSS